MIQKFGQYELNNPDAPTIITAKPTENVNTIPYG